jgi:hypothetical protein
MKRIFALALVGLLSISSLASTDAPDISEGLLPPDKISCPAEYEFIEGNSKIKGFCITKSVQKPMRLSDAKENCNEQIHNGRKAFLCGFKEWKLACENNGKELKMSKEYDGSTEFVANLYFFVGQVMGPWGCDSSRSSDSANVRDSNGSRCCFR